MTVRTRAPVGTKTRATPATGTSPRLRKTVSNSTAAKPSKGNNYNEDSIQHHKGLAGVRAKPSMYLGERGNPMVLKCIKELVDNALDEFLAGRNKEIEVWADNKSTTYIIADKAQGIPVGIHKKAGISTLTLIFTELHAGGKFTEGSYSAAVGTHGVGSSAVNAVSKSFEVWTFREQQWWHQAFSKGKPLFEIKKAKPPQDVLQNLRSKSGYGTIIRIVPDQTIVSNDKGKTTAVLDVKLALPWLRNLALLNKNLKVTFTSNNKTRVYLNTVGLIKLLKTRIAKEQLEVMGRPLVFESDKLAFAVQWTSYTEDDGVQSFVSCSPTRDGGSHIDEFFSALIRALTPYKGQRDKFTPRDIRNGLIGVLNWNMNSPEFSSQVKDRLTSNLGKSLYNVALDFFTKFFGANKALARRIIRRANEAKKAKEEFKKMMDGISKINQSKRGLMLPNILASARRCTSKERELYVVEGESAAGSAKKARNSNYQEVLRLQGKPTNGIRKPLAQLLKSKPVLNILAALGYDHKREHPHEHLRVQKLFCLADADPDGWHINALILTIIYRMMPELFDEGRVYICNAPLYSSFYKGKRYFGSTFEECYSQMPAGAPKDIVSRAKGWGELSPEALEVIAFHPDTRNLIQIRPSKNKGLDYYLRIMGSDTTARKTLLGL